MNTKESFVCTRGKYKIRKVVYQPARMRKGEEVMENVSIDQKTKIKRFIDQHPETQFRTADLWLALGKDEGFGGLTSLATLLPKMYHAGLIQRVEKGLYTAKQNSILQGMRLPVQEEKPEEFPGRATQEVIQIISRLEKSADRFQAEALLYKTRMEQAESLLADRSVQVEKLNAKVEHYERREEEFGKMDEIVLSLCEGRQSLRKALEGLDILLPQPSESSTEEEAHNEQPSAEKEVSESLDSPFE
jgi:hypothetical protein